MTKNSLVFAFVAVLVAGVVAAAVATSMFGGSTNGMNHAMPNGQTMNGGQMDMGGGR